MTDKPQTLHLVEHSKFTFAYYQKMAAVAMALAQAGRFINITQDDKGTYILTVYEQKQ